MKITIRRKDGHDVDLDVADNKGPLTSAWLGAMMQAVCTPNTGVISLMPPLMTIPFRAENTNRPLLGGEIN